MSNIQEEIQRRTNIIGRREELLKCLTSMENGQHILLEGPVGVGKTELALAITRYLNKVFCRIDGDERYTEQKLVGWFDPPMVISKGYSWETFIAGPLTESMKDGKTLFINELNRMPEGTQNVLLPAMDEKQINIPKLGPLQAKEGFVVIATQNPEEFVGTSRLSEAMRDRFVWIELKYQSAEEEEKIVKLRTGCENEELVKFAVRVIRKTRESPKVRRGSSVRGAIDIVKTAQNLMQALKSQVNLEILSESSIMALTTKIELEDEANKTKIIEEIVREEGSLFFKELYETCPEKLVQYKSQSYMNELQDLLIKYNLKDDNTLSALLNLARINPSRAGSFLSANKNVSIKILSDFERQRFNSLMLPKLYTHVWYELPKELRNFMKRLAIRIILRIASQISVRNLLGGVPVLVPYKVGLEEVAIEETLENYAEKSYVEGSDIICIDREPKKKSAVLILDSSCSMYGENLAVAAVTVSVLAFTLKEDYYSVILFSSRPKILKPITLEKPIEKILDQLLKTHSGGATNIYDALSTALDELRKARTQDRVAILITDGMVTSGDDPRRIADKFKHLHVIQTAIEGVCNPGTDSHFRLMCKNLSRLGKGKHLVVEKFAEVPEALIKIMR